MDEAKRPVPPNSGVEIRTPMRMNVSYDQARAIPGMPKELSDLARVKQAQCDTTVHQLICVEGTVVTTVTADCDAEAICLNFGIGTCPTDLVTGVEGLCTFKFFQELCVEVDVFVSASASCTIDAIHCGGVETGPCPTLPTLPTEPTEPTLPTLPTEPTLPG